jgi:hypothetical protein
MKEPTIFDIVGHRGEGWTRYVCVDRNPIDTETELYKRLGLAFDGHALREVDAKGACALLTEIFSRGLVFRSREVNSPVQARSMANMCIDRLFPAGARYFTNVAETVAGMGILDAQVAVEHGHTFSVGIVAVSEDAAACVWVEEED